MKLKQTKSKIKKTLGYQSSADKDNILFMPSQKKKKDF